jgi:hypothetical protein
MKYCKRCGAQVLTNRKADDAEKAEELQAKKRMDEYLDGIFWITVFGLGFILGGMVILRKFGLGDWLLISYLILSSTAFLINLALNLWQIYLMTRKPEQAKVHQQLEVPDTNELVSASAQPVLEPALSVTENTTHRLERIPGELDS